MLQNNIAIADGHTIFFFFVSTTNELGMIMSIGIFFLLHISKAS